MDFAYSTEDNAFREDVRAFIRANLPSAMAARVYRGAHPPLKADMVHWNRALFEKGWAAPHWPKEYGGTGWSALKRHIFEEECYRADAPDTSWQGLRLVAPVIYTFGAHAQKARYLPTILSGEELWAQGFSEPGAGSDLASLRTTAIVEGDQYVVNGQKIWTSEAQYADMGFFLVKTDTAVKPQAGISFLLIPMNTPGITVRPIASIEGGCGLNEVFLENVRVPVENLVGEAGKGWSYAKYLLENERTSSAFIYFNKRELDKAKALARREALNGKPLIEDPGFARRIAQVEIDVLALEWSVLRVLANEPSAYDLTSIASALKLRGSELQQRTTELQIDALGLRGLRFYPHPHTADDLPPVDNLWPDGIAGRSAAFLFTRAATIYGGTREVQKNIIAKTAFGL